MRIDNKKNDAVSPVVGIMLILVVTIIVAALVAAFATGLAGSAGVTAPTATFEWTLHASGGQPGHQYTSADAGTSTTTWTQPGVECCVPAASGEFSSNDLKIITSYVVPDKFEGTLLADAGKTITTTTTGRVEDYGFSISDLGSTARIDSPVNGNDIPYYKADDDPFKEHTYINRIHIMPTPGNGMTVGTGQNELKFFGGNSPIGSGTLWWFKDISALLGFDITKRNTYGFTEGSIVHITVIHIPSGTAIYDKDVKAVW